MVITTYLINLISQINKSYGINIDYEKIDLTKKTYVIYNVITMKVTYMYEDDKIVEKSTLIPALVEHTGILIFDISTKNDRLSLSVYEISCKYEKLFGLFIGGELNG